MLRFVPRSAKITRFPRPEGMPEALYRVLVGRGVGSAEAAEAFLNPGKGDLADSMALSHMGEAVERIRGALDGGEVVCVYGDYDVDGVCASAILSGWLRSAGADARVYLPSRHGEGYGLNEAAVREIAGWAGLLVTVDCGVTNIDLVALAKSLGLDVVVTDHHRPAKDPETGELRLPDCPVVNPQLADYPCPQLCGAGVAWKLVWALGGEAAAMPWVDVAALATVADVVSLTGENRAIVALGLEAVNRRPRPGVAALIEAAGLSGKRITSAAVAFQLAPRLNAGGRMGSAARSLRLIEAADPAEAAPLAAELEAENARRRQVELEILRQAEAQLAGFDFAAHRALILAGEGWNPGVIGLAASRLVEKYNYPVVLLAANDGVLTGSCRSIEGVDIHAALTGCAHTMERFGGHRQAAGLTLRPERLAEFREALEAWLWANTDPRAYIPACPYDGELDFEAVTPGLIGALEALQPTGFGNPSPLFRARAAVVEARAVGAEGAHLKLTLAQGGHRLGGIAFREGERAQTLGDEADVLFAAKLNTWMGRAEPQLEVRALADGDPARRLASKLKDEPAMVCEFLTQVFYNKKIPPDFGLVPEIDADTLAAWLDEGPQGTLVVAGDFACAGRVLRLSEGCPPDLYLGRLPGDPRAFNAVCACPAGNAIPLGYRRIVLAGVPAQWLPEDPGGAVYRLADAPAWLNLLPDLAAMREAYRALMRVARRPAWCESLARLARLVAEEAGQPEVTAAASILAMADMALFRLAARGNTLAVERSDRPKADPDASAVWNAIQSWRSGELDGMISKSSFPIL